MLEGRIDGRRKRAKPRRRWTDDVKDWPHRSVAECSRLARDRRRWGTLVHEMISDSQHWGWKAASKQGPALLWTCLGRAYISLHQSLWLMSWLFDTWQGRWAGGARISERGVYCAPQSLATENPRSCRNYVIFRQNYDFAFSRENEKVHKRKIFARANIFITHISRSCKTDGIEWLDEVSSVTSTRAGLSPWIPPSIYPWLVQVQARRLYYCKCPCSTPQRPTVNVRWALITINDITQQLNWICHFQTPWVTQRAWVTWKSILPKQVNLCLF